MKYRETTLLGRTDLGEAGTKVIDINLLDPISRIDICFEIRNWSAEWTAQLGSCLPKIELVDGSEVLFSMNGLEAQALNIYDRKVSTMNGDYYNAGNLIMGNYGIDFGRFLYDPELAFDPKQFRNPQLKLTWDEDAMMAVTGVNYMEVLASVFDEKIISPIGFLMSKKHYAYTPTAADAYQYIDLPTDHPIRKMLIRGFLEKTDPYKVVDEARLSEDNDKRVVFDMNLQRHIQKMRGVWSPVIELWQEYGSPAVGIYDIFFTPTHELSFPAIIGRVTGSDPWVEDSMPGGYLSWRSGGGTYCQGMVIGYLPNHCIELPFGLPDEIDSWYDVQNKGSVQLRLLSAASFAGSVISVILQQMRRY